LQMKKFIPSILALAILASCSQSDQLRLEQLEKDYAALQDKAAAVVPASAEPSADEQSEYSFGFDQLRYGIDAGGSISIRYSLPEPSTVEVAAKEGWRASVTADSATEGTITVTAPDPASPCDIVATATAQDGSITAVTLPVMVRDPYSAATRPVMDALGYYLRTHNRSLENCRKLAAAGLTIVTVESEDADFEELMDMCRQAGLKVLLIAGGYVARAYSDPARYPELVSLVAKMKNHPELYGWHICDEPSINEAALLKGRKDMLEALDPDHPVYINYHPDASPSSLGVDTYKEYIDRFTDYLDQDLISFDIYPVLPGSIMPSWHMCLKTVAEAAKRHNVPFWTFAASCWIDRESLLREKPNAYNERMQIYTGLAYGSQCIQYFTIHQYGGTSYAPFMADGSWSQAYEEMKEANLEMQRRAFVFRGSNVTKVRQAGEMSTYSMALSPGDLPEEIEDIHSNGSVTASFVENNGNEYIAIVNNYWNVDQDVAVDANDWYYEIDKDGNFIEHGPGVSYLKVEKGGMTVLKYR